MSQPATEEQIDCPFCIPPVAQVIRKADLIFTLYDGFPVSPGHALIVPRRHIALWKEATPEEKTAIWNEIDDARAIIESRYHPDGFNVGFNDGSAAGQTVMHLHVHIIPRYSGDVVDPRGGVRWVLAERAAYWNADPK